MMAPRWLVPGVMLALAGCAAPRPQHPQPEDERLAQLARGARTAFDQDDPRRAVVLHEQALQRALVLDDPGEIGNAAYNLAMTLVRAGDYNRAGRLLREAEAELIRANANLADVLLVQAMLAHTVGDHATASRLAGEVLMRPQSRPRGVHHAQVLLLRGMIAAEAGDSTRSREALETAREMIGEDAEVELRARLTQLAGRVALLEGQPLGAARNFDREAARWQQAGQFREMTRALLRAADAYQSGEDPDRASERLYRAARSALAQGAELPAHQWLKRADALARRAGNATLQQRISDLEAELNGDAIGGTDP
jgi:tetratricopeptide (TPR) repeat protein